MNKILIFWGLAVFAILLIENMIMPTTGFVLWFTTKWFNLVIASAVVWFCIWYWVRWLSSNGDKDDSEIDF